MLGTMIGTVVRKDGKDFNRYVKFEGRTRRIYEGVWEDLYIIVNGKKYDVLINEEDEVYFTGIVY